MGHGDGEARTVCLWRQLVKKGEWDNIGVRRFGYSPSTRNKGRQCVIKEGYESVVLLQREEAQRAIEILSDEGDGAALEFLKQWHDPGEGTLIMRPGDPWQAGDAVYREGAYTMYYNLATPYIGLVCKL